MNVIPPIGGGLATYAVRSATNMYLDPLTTHRFVLEVQGIFVGGFMSIEGIGAKTEVEEVREGGANGVVYKLPGQTTYPNLVLRSGLTLVDPMWLWYRSTLQGKPLRRHGTIYLMDDFRVPVAWWNFHNAMLIEWHGPQFDSMQAHVAVQQFTLAYERIVKGLSSTAAGAAAKAAERFI